MFKHVFAALFFSFFVNVAFAQVDGPNFVILPNIKTTYLMATDAPQAIAIQSHVIELVKSTLNINSQSPFKTVRIRMVYNSQNELQSLIVYLLSTQFKSFDLVRINLNNEMNVEEIIHNYRLKPQDLDQSPTYAYKSAPHCPDNTVQFVIGNNFTGDASVEHEIQKIYQLAKAKGYNPFLMDSNDQNGPQPTVQAYEDWMSCPNVKGFYNESHGFEEGIILADDDFVYSLIERDLTNKLAHEVILFDSCVTFHNPLFDSMTSVDKGNSQQYIAGIIYLPFGPSERAASCFWTNALNHQPLTKKMVQNCDLQSDLEKDGFGIAGNGAKYLAKPL